MSTSLAVDASLSTFSDLRTAHRAQQRCHSSVEETFRTYRGACMQTSTVRYACWRFAKGQGPVQFGLHLDGKKHFHLVQKLHDGGSTLCTAQKGEL